MAAVGVNTAVAGVKSEEAQDAQVVLGNPRSGVAHEAHAPCLKVGKTAEAEQVYRDDLKKLPNNGWSLYGLADSLRKQGKTDEAAAVDARFKEVWSKADIQITTSCLCQAGVATAK